MHEQPSGSRTVVEKLEKYSDKVGYAVVTLSPDDVGCLSERYLRLHDVLLSRVKTSGKRTWNSSWEASAIEWQMKLHVQY